MHAGHARVAEEAELFISLEDSPVFAFEPGSRNVINDNRSILDKYNFLSVIELS